MLKGETNVKLDFSIWQKYLSKNEIDIKTFTVLQKPWKLVSSRPVRNAKDIFKTDKTKIFFLSLATQIEMA